MLDKYNYICIMKNIFIAIILTLSISSCTENERARNFGGVEDILLEPNEVFVNITWKGDDIWIITRDTSQNVYLAREKSSYGIWNGKIIIHD